MSLFSSDGLNTTASSGTQTSVSPYAQPYVDNLLSKSQALGDAAMPAYTGQLTAGPSDLQTQAWEGISNLTVPDSLKNAGASLHDTANQFKALTYNPSTGTFDQTAATQYMNPYIQTALNPQLEALQRQQQINQQGDLAKLTQAGAYGGSRQAILEGQNNYNLLAQQAALTGSGYNQAYKDAMAQYNADTNRNTQDKQFAATHGIQTLQGATAADTAASNSGAQVAQYGLANLQAMEKAGSNKQALMQAADNAQYNEYLRQLNYKKDMLTFEKNQLQGLPMTKTDTFSAAPSGLQNASTATAGISGILKDMGYTPEQIKKYVTNLFGDKSSTTQINDTTGMTPSTNQNPTGSETAGLLQGADGQWYVDPTYGTGGDSSTNPDASNPDVTP
jgi:hypothetical protein